MNDATQPHAGDGWHEHAFDLTRGIAAYCASPLVGALARVIARHPDADLANAFNHKQVACKMWARDQLFNTAGGRFETIWILGGWYGVLAAMLFEDRRFSIGHIDSIDIDPGVAEVASTLNGDCGGRFRALTADMYRLGYRREPPDLVVNTSCEHIADVPGWLALLAPGTRVLLQSNDYFREPSHVSCVADLAAFERLAALASIDYAGALPTRNYTRFMLVGRV